MNNYFKKIKVKVGIVGCSFLFIGLIAGSVFAEEKHHEYRGVVYFDHQNKHMRYQTISRIDISGKNFVHITSGKTLDRVPDACRDGNSITFESWRNGNPDIYIMNKDGSKQRALTSNEAIDSYPRFTADCQSIVFFSNRSGNYDIYSVKVNQPHVVTQLTSLPANEYDPAVSPNGNTLTFSSDAEGNFDIFMKHLKTGELTQLTHSKFDDIHSSFSPDGSMITFRSNRTGQFEVYTMWVDGSHLDQITDGMASARHPSFSPDGRSIIFHSVEGQGRAAIAIVPVEGGDVSYLTSFNEAHLNGTWVSH